MRSARWSFRCAGGVPLAVVLLVGCAGTGPVAPDPLPEPSEPPPSAEPSEPEGVAIEAPMAIVRMIEDGEYPRAQAALEARIANGARDALTRSLLDQLTADPAQVLGPVAGRHPVEPGETLSGLAQRYLGDPMLFVILARYNGIARPRALEIGRVLAVPARPASAAAVADSDADPGEPPWTGERYRREIEAALASGEIASAQELLARAQQARPGTGEWQPWLRRLSDRVEAETAQRRALATPEATDLASREAAFADLQRALALVPGLEPATSALPAVRTALVEALHREAVVHFRNQRVDPALVLWDRALALDPEFEPAQGYRQRALEIRRRLETLPEADPVPEG